MAFSTSAILQAGIAGNAVQRLPRYLSRYPPPFNLGRIQCRHFISRFFRPKPQVLTKVEVPGTKQAYGERVLVYYAGQRIVFVATLKLATLFVFSFCTFIAAPSVGVETEYGYWAPVAG